MKKIINLLLLTFIATVTANAQIKKAALLLGGQISFYSNKYNNTLPTTKNNGAGLGLSLGKAYKENNVAGVYASYGQNKNENRYSNSNYSTSNSYNYGAGVFYRQYKNLSRNFYFFGEINGGFSGFKQTQENVQPNFIDKFTNTQNGIQLGITPGLSYQIYKKLQLEILAPSVAGLSFAATKNTSQNTTTKGSTFQLSSSLNSNFLNNIALGFKFVL